MRRWIAFLVALAAPSVAFAQEMEVYTVKAGDTCSSIAEAFYGDARFFTSIHRANDLGEPPHVLKPGMKLNLPTEAEATLSRKRGRVQAQAPKAGWTSASEGLELYRAWRVNTLEQARALVGFRDDSELVLRENTLIVIFGDAQSSTQQRGGRAVLESGALRSRLGELSGVTVETPTATAKLGEGSAVVAVDGESATLVSNHEGAATQFASKSAPAAPVTVKAGYGSKAKKNERPSKPRPLPPRPIWEAGPRSFATFDSSTISASWHAVPQAARYFVEVTSDAGGVQVMQAVYAPAEVTRLEVQGLPTGSYYATVSAIDEEGFESIPAERLELRVARIAAPPGSISTEEPLRFYAGTTLTAPAGLTCRADEAQPHAQQFAVVARNAPRVAGVSYPGHQEQLEIECTDGDVTTTVAAEVEIPAFELQEVGDALQLHEGGVATVAIAFEDGWVQTEATGAGLETATKKAGATSSYLGVRADGVPGEQLVISAGGAPILDVAVEHVATPVDEGKIPSGLGLSLTGFGTPAGVLGSTEATAGIGAQLFALVDVAPWFTLGAGVGGIEVLGSENTFSFAPMVDARFAVPSNSVRPYVAVGARAWLPLAGGVYGSFEPGLGTTIRLGNWGLDLRGHASVFSGDGVAKLAPGLTAGLYRRF